MLSLLSIHTSQAFSLQYQNINKHVYMNIANANLHVPFKVVIINNLEQKQKSAYNAENTTDLPKTLQVPFLCCFS